MSPQEAATRLVESLAEYDGVNPENIRSVRLTPTSIELETYETDASGAKFISGDTIATATRKLPFRYRP